MRKPDGLTLIRPCDTSGVHIHCVLPRERRCSRRAFTLIELLVVVSIVALLISLLIPALGRARESARSVVCMATQRTLGMAWRAYVDENDGYTPYAVTQRDADNVAQIAPYLGYAEYVFEDGSGNYRSDGGESIPALFCPSVTSETILSEREPGFVNGSPAWPYSDYGINISASCNFLKSGTIGASDAYWNWGDSRPRTVDRQQTPAAVIAYLDSVLGHVGIDVNWGWPFDYPNGRWYTEWGRYWGNPYVHGNRDTVNAVYMDAHVSSFTVAELGLREVSMHEVFREQPWSSEFD